MKKKGILDAEALGGRIDLEGIYSNDEWIEKQRRDFNLPKLTYHQAACSANRPLKRRFNKEFVYKD